MWAAFVNIILGVWLMASPSVFAFEKIAADNNYITGPLVITFAIIAVWEVNRSARYGTLLAGAWLLLSPFLLGYDDTTTKWITVATGLLIILCSLVKGKLTRRYGGGWRALFAKNKG